MDSRQIIFLFACLALFLQHTEQKTMYMTELYTQTQFSQSVLSQPHLILYFAPWCPHSQAFFKTWVEFISQRSLSSEVKSALVDCSSETDLCVSQNILAYPTIKFYHPAIHKNPVRFRGERTVARIKHFLFDMVAKAFEETNKPPKSIPPPEHYQTVVSLDSNNWEKVTDFGSFFIKFFTSWCPVCQELEPKWRQLALNMGEDTRYSIAEVDCDLAPLICSTNRVGSYPTLIWFHNGMEIHRYKGELEIESMQAFIDKSLDLNNRFYDISTGTVPEWIAQVPSIDIQNEVEFVRVLSKYKLVFVKFYVPWCRYCKELNPKWTEMSRLLMRDHPNRVTIVNVDCVVNKQLCTKVRIRGYPTLVLYRDGNSVELYRGPRDATAMVTFLVQHFETEPTATKSKIEL